MSGTDRESGDRTQPEAYERTARGLLEEAGRGHPPELLAAPAAVSGDTDLRAEARFMARMLAVAVRGGGSARLAGLIVHELAACGIGVSASRHDPGDVLPFRRESIEAVRPGFTLLRAMAVIGMARAQASVAPVNVACDLIRSVCEQTRLAQAEPARVPPFSPSGRLNRYRVERINFVHYHLSVVLHTDAFNVSLMILGMD